MSHVMERSLLRTAPGGALRGLVAMPGDKSISHRALILGAFAEGETRIEGLSEGADVMTTVAAVRALGAEVTRAGDGGWTVRGTPIERLERLPALTIDCGNSGTTARLLIGALACRPVAVTFTGDASLSARPMDRVLDPLRARGVWVSPGNTLPVTIKGRLMDRFTHQIPLASAQVKSALLLAGLVGNPVEVTEPTKSRDHTERMLAAFGCEIEVDGNTVRLGQNRKLTGIDIMVPGDPSSAAFPLVAALLVPGSEVTVAGVMMNPLRTGLFRTLGEMGADLVSTNRRTVGGEEVADLTARHSSLRGVEVPVERVPSMIDEVPILAIAAAFATGRTIMHGLAELRVKESDRLAAILDGLTRCGVRAEVAGDSLVVEGGDVPGGTTVATQGDHRIAMSFLILGLAAQAPVAVDAPEMIATSFPGFADLMVSLGAEIGAP